MKIFHIAYKIKIRWKLWNVYRKFLSEVPLAESVVYPAVIFDLKQKRFEKYYYFLMHAFSSSNYHVYLVDRWDLIGSFLHLINAVIKIKNLSLIKEVPVGFSGLVIQDYAKENKGFIDTHLYGVDGVKNDIVVLPYPMSAHVYETKLLQSIVVNPQEKRKYKIVFSGNVHPDTYQNTIFKNYFKVLNRYQIFTIIQKCMTENNLFLVHDFDSFINEKSDVSSKLILMDWVWSKDGRLNKLAARVPNDQWLSLLNETDFFIHAPGIHEPLCHSHTESIAVGVIPITEFPHLYNPPLVHMKNAIVFNGEKDLIDKINYCFSLSNDQVSELRVNVIDYYNTYLSEKSAVGLLELNQSKACYFHTDYAIQERG